MFASVPADGGSNAGAKGDPGMLPKIVLHKTNGHSHLPRDTRPSLGAIIREVHTGGESGRRPTFGLLKFATVVRSERRSALIEEAVRHVDGLHSALSALLARTEAAFARGELADVRSGLSALRAQATDATRLFARLLASAETRTATHGLVNVNELVADAAARADADDAPVEAQLDPSAPWVIGNVARLERALVTFVEALGSEVSIATSQVDGVIRGERVVRLDVRGDGPLAPRAAAALGAPLAEADPEPEAFDVHVARQIVAEHGGVVSVIPDTGAGSVIRIELPGV
jgi:C4-dicarboxylate-specific signal transduction histidine kinase